MKVKKKELWDWIKAILIAVVFAAIIRNFLFTPIEVSGESMMPTLQNEDRMIVSKIGEINRFDIVVFNASEDKDFIKRVIGLPGDTIEYKDDMLYVNGQKYDEPYLKEQKELHYQSFLGPLTEDFTLEEKIGTITVPKDTLFVLGDNRKNSMDSRQIGVIPIDAVIGKTNIVYWPPKDIQLVK